MPLASSPSVLTSLLRTLRLLSFQSAQCQCTTYIMFSLSLSPVVLTVIMYVSINLFPSRYSGSQASGCVWLHVIRKHLSWWKKATLQTGEVQQLSTQAVGDVALGSFKYSPASERAAGVALWWTWSSRFVRSVSTHRSALHTANTHKRRQNCNAYNQYLC